MVELNDGYPQKSWILQNPLYKCQYCEGKCMLKHYPDSVEIDCENRNKPYCQFRLVEDKGEANDAV